MISIASSSLNPEKLLATERATAWISLIFAASSCHSWRTSRDPWPAGEMIYDGDEDGERLSLGLGLGVAVTAFTRSAKSGLS
jgi:hypothetical protein